jgi:hypothetical protein
MIVSKTWKVYLPGLVAERMPGVLHIAHVGSSPDRPTSEVLDILDAESFASRLRAPYDRYVINAYTWEVRYNRYESFPYGYNQRLYWANGKIYMNSVRQ